MWLLLAQDVVELKDTKTTSRKRGGCSVSGFGKNEGAESQDKMKMDEGHQDMEMTTSKWKENLKELSACKLEELDQLHPRAREERAIKLQVQQQVIEINLLPFRTGTGK